jgi:hypothetical protein
MPNTPNQALPYPALSDPANGPVGFQNLALALEKQLVMAFASSTDRSTKVPTPVEGMLAYLKDVDRLEIYNGATATWERVGTVPLSEVTYLKHTAGAAKRVHRQDYTGGTTDASGFLTVTHAAGFTPTAVQVASRAGGTTFAVFWGADTFAATTVRLRFHSATATGSFNSAATGAFTAWFWE